MSSINEMEIFFSNFLSGVEMLAAGRLPTVLVDQETLGDTLLNISDTLAESHSQWKVINTAPTYYYSYGTFIHVRDATHLFITLQIPLARHDQPFNIFELLTFALPTHDSNEHATRLIGLPHAVAFDVTGRYMFPLTSSELKDIDKYHTSHVRRIFHQMSADSCVVALYKDNTESIMKNCKFQIELDSKTKEIIQLNEEEFLLLNIEKYTIQMEDGTKMSNSCRSCIVTLSKGEFLKTKEYYISPNLKNASSVPRVRHVTNLALIYALFNEDKARILSFSSYDA